MHLANCANAMFCSWSACVPKRRLSTICVNLCASGTLATNTSGCSFSPTARSAEALRGGYSMVASNKGLGQACQAGKERAPSQASRTLWQSRRQASARGTSWALRMRGGTARCQLRRGTAACESACPACSSPGHHRASEQGHALAQGHHARTCTLMSCSRSRTLSASLYCSTDTCVASASAIISTCEPSGAPAGTGPRGRPCSVMDTRETEVRMCMRW